jgi:tRNA threonylcarbamoyladenosine biosynthesis protein TsaB
MAGVSTVPADGAETGGSEEGCVTEGWMTGRVEYTIDHRRTSVLTLALDTTTRGGSAALTDTTSVLGLVPGDAARTHGERLPGDLAQALREAGRTLADVGLLAVAHGPGAFTGIRIGLACMQGLAVTTGLPVVGVSALEALAYAHSRGTAPVWLGACMDAGRGEVFLQWFRPDISRAWGMAPVEAPAVMAVQAVTAPVAIPADGPLVLCGDGATRLGAHLGPHWQVADDVGPLAPAVAALAHLTWIADPDAQRWMPDALEPLYVRRPDVEITREAQRHP